MKCLPSAVFALTLGLPGLVWLGMAYEFKDHLFSLWKQGAEQQSSDISVLMHCLRRLLKIPTHREFDFVSVGWWAFLTSHLR